MQVSERGLKLIEGFEGFVDHQYRDSVGVLTIGYGTTEADVSPLPTHLTQAQAEQLLRKKLDAKYAPAINGLGVELNQNQFDALVSLAYNVGPGVVGWQIGTDLRAHNYSAASADFMHYVYAGGQVLQGLVTRRAAERKLFDTPVKPTDPHHYKWLDGTVRHLGHLGKASEQTAAAHYDHLRAMQTASHHPHREELHLIRERLSVLQHRLENVIEETHDSKSFHREWRLRQLRERARGRRVV